MFGSIAVPLQRSRFTERWVEIVRDGAPAQLSRMIGPVRSLGIDRQAHFVNASMNAAIHYQADPGPEGDNWATARETLARKSGDCEDIAIAKLQALRALGVPLSHLYLTIGWEDRVGAVHALLLLRVGQRLWVLDNRRDEVLPQESRPDFYPIITFAADAGWLHGYSVRTTPPALRTVRYARRTEHLRAAAGTPVRSAFQSIVQAQRGK